jgi:SAM-dependent methyltransferase
MNHTLPSPDRKGIIVALEDGLSAENIGRQKKFGPLMFLYDFVQDRFVRPRLHLADPARHRELLSRALTEVILAAPGPAASSGAPAATAAASPGPGTASGRTAGLARLLDIGCGTGAAIDLLPPGVDYTGLDLSYHMLKVAVKRGRGAGPDGPPPRFVQGNAEELPFGDGSFEAVLIDTSIHMIPKWKKALDEAARVLVRSGSLVCSVPTVGILPEFDAKWSEISGPRHLNSLTEQDLAKACLASGLRYTMRGINGAVLYFSAVKE